jgi:uroporphyrinogen-III synthase
VTSSAERALAGRCVVVTRAAEQASTLVGRLTERGAAVVEMPTVAIADASDAGESLRAAVADLEGYDWVVLTSVNGVERFATVLAGRDVGTVKIGAVGPGTAAALEHAGLPVALVPERFVAEGLLDVFPPGPGRVLLPQAAAARPVLAEGLRQAGWQVDTVAAYRTVAARPDPTVLGRAAGADAITFTSGSTVTNYVQAAGLDALPPVVVCIGPVTAEAATAAGMTVTSVAREHTIDGLVDAVVAALS